MLSNYLLIEGTHPAQVNCLVYYELPLNNFCQSFHSNKCAAKCKLCQCVIVLRLARCFPGYNGYADADLF